MGKLYGYCKWCIYVNMYVHTSYVLQIPTGTFRQVHQITTYLEVCRRKKSQRKSPVRLLMAYIVSPCAKARVCGVSRHQHTEPTSLSRLFLRVFCLQFFFRWQVFLIFVPGGYWYISPMPHWAERLDRVHMYRLLCDQTGALALCLTRWQTT